MVRWGKNGPMKGEAGRKRRKKVKGWDLCPTQNRSLAVPLIASPVKWHIFEMVYICQLAQNLRVEVWWGKVACWSTKATISLKRVKIEQKLLWRAYRNSPTLFRMVPSPTPYGLPFPKIGGFQLQPKTAITIILGMGKATDCKFRRYIHRVHPNKTPWKILEKRERGCIPGLPKFFEYPLLSQKRVKLRTSNLVRTFIGSIGTKAH